MVTVTSALGLSASRPSMVAVPARVALAVTLCTLVASVAARTADTEDDVDEYPFDARTLAALTNPASSFALARSAAPTTRLSFEGRAEPLTGLRPQPLPGGVSTSLLDVSNRVWLGYGRAAVGVGFGVQTPRVDQPLGIADAPMQATRPSVSVGWRYSLTPGSQFYAGASAARAWGTDDDLPRYNARAGVEWKTAKSRIGFDGGRLGLQLDSGYRMSIRTRSGGVQLALRRTF